MDRRKYATLKDTVKPSSRAWLLRHINDPYVQKAGEEGYRSRAAYKLLHIQEKTKIFKEKARVVDMGCAPGGWCQVLARASFKMSVVGIDCLPMPAIPGVHFIQGDLTQQDIQDQVRGIFPQCDLFLSDAAPSTIGHPQTDHLRMMDLLEQMWDFGKEILAPKGHAVFKVFQGHDLPEFIKNMRALFTEVHLVKPLASRHVSVEHYIVAKRYKGN